MSHHQYEGLQGFVKDGHRCPRRMCVVLQGIFQAHIGVLAGFVLWSSLTTVTVPDPLCFPRPRHAGLPALFAALWRPHLPKHNFQTTNPRGVVLHSHTLRLKIAQSRPYLYTLGPKVGIIYIHGAPGILHLLHPLCNRGISVVPLEPYMESISLNWVQRLGAIESPLEASPCKHAQPALVVLVPGRMWQIAQTAQGGETLN